MGTSELQFRLVYWTVGVWFFAGNSTVVIPVTFLASKPIDGSKALLWDIARTGRLSLLVVVYCVFWEYKEAAVQHGRWICTSVKKRKRTPQSHHEAVLHL
ncbi:hypothetical protein NQ315_016586 [Exocentrus adspersus]|uniref:Uncharacterized protein n=1 Tax=Exocentrus adspersus TaxID=1586481 RepID=A0AAV8VDS4_9CUCU|nr:hypothetical protein NQ315_016586 [Exocentrus adspersus]